MDVLFKQTVKIREDFNANETGFIKNESNGKIDVQIKEFYGFGMKQHLVRSSEPRDFWSVLWRKINFQHKTSFIFLF